MGKASCILFAALCLAVVYSLPVDQQPQKKSSDKQQVALPTITPTAKPVHHYRDGPLRKRDIHQSSDSSSSEEDSRSDEQKKTDSQHLLLRQVSAGSQKQENSDLNNNPNILASNPSSPTGPSTLSPHQNRSKRDLSEPVSTADPPTRVNLGADLSHTSEGSTRKVRDLGHSQVSSTTPSTTSEPTKILLNRGSEVASPSEREQRDLKDQLESSTQPHSGSSQSSGNPSNVPGEQRQLPQRDTSDQQSSTSGNQPQRSGQSTQTNPSVTEEQQNRQRRDINNQQSSTTTNQPQRSDQSSQNYPSVTGEQHHLQQKDVNDQQSSTTKNQPQTSDQSSQNNPSGAGDQHHHQRRYLNSPQASTDRPSTTVRLSQNPPHVSKETSASLNGDAVQNYRQRRDVGDQQGSTLTSQPSIAASTAQTAQNEESSVASQNHDLVSSPPHVLLSNTASTTEKEDNSHIQKISS